MIVGAGTSGSVLAARLCATPSLAVTLLESGEPDDYTAEILEPVRASEVWSTFANSKVVAMESSGGPIVMLQGRILGGTSAINYLATVRGQPADYDSWAAGGLAGWGWSDVRRYFIAAENDGDFGPSDIHGDSGPLRVSRWTTDEHRRFQRAFGEGLREIGVPPVADVNDPTQVPGIGVFPATLDTARQRMTTSTAYLTDDVRKRSNLQIRTRATVTRVLIENGRAVGVLLDSGEEVFADEIVLSAGAIATPALLLRSGVGPRIQLAEHNLPVHADLPVGATMSDHLGTVLSYQYDEPHTNCGGPAQSVLVGSSNGKDIDYHVFPTPSLTPGDSSAFLLLAYLLRSSGAGKVVLGDSPDHDPVVTAPPLPDDTDARLGHAFQLIAEWERSTAARAIGIRAVEPHDLTSVTAVKEALARMTISYGHMVGTCPMGPVLDAQGRVHGIAGLRVGDGSAMPSIPAGNTYLGCVMVAERIADFITADED